MELLMLGLGARQNGKSLALAAIAGAAAAATIAMETFGRASRRGKRLRDEERRLRNARRKANEEGRCQRRLSRPALEYNIDFESICSCCKRPGSHFFPPSLGEPGFFICWKEKR